MSTITVSDLTQAITNGSGIFDVLMKATKAHLDEEFKQNRLKGSEYATVYLGAMQSTMQTALAFLLQKEKAGLEAENLRQENLNLIAAECKLRAEFDVLQATVLKTDTETALLTQKVATEKAQTDGIAIDPESILGKQKALYGAQATGFTRDAEQKAAKLMADTWNVRRTTDEGTVADGTNMLNDAAVGRAINKLLSGVGA